MKFWKSILCALLLTSAPLCLYANQAGEGKENACQYDGGFWVGINYGSLNSQQLLTNWALMVGYSSEWFLADLGYSFIYTQFQSSGNDAYENELFAHLGGRVRSKNSNLFWTYGLTGSYRFLHPNVVVKDPWEAGVFVGLDYQLSENYMIQAKISPYTYMRDVSSDKLQNVFARGNITFAYVF